MTALEAGPVQIGGPETRVLFASVEPGSLTVRITCGEERFGEWSFDDLRGDEQGLLIRWLEPARTLSLLGADGSLGEPASGGREEGSVVWPEMTLEVASGEETASTALKVTETSLLKDYYQREGHQQQYVVQHPFFEAFHQGRLRCLGRIFRRYIPPGSRVLDVGSGYGIFYMISQDWPFELTCCDLDTAAMEKMRGLAPQWQWVVADALDLPWPDASFDVLYAGEIIEHVPEPAAALAEWSRVLKQRGVMVLSTPNRDRLLARANREVMPVHHEHVMEMNLQELRDLVNSGGFTVLETTGVYLEFLINWWRPRGRRVDLLTARLGHPRYARLYKASMDMGRLLPSRAFDLVVVCRKR